jgi:hypothetical protein
MAKSTDNAAGQALAEVLPQNDKAWYRVPYLLKLNLLLMIPLMSSAVAGFDGKSAPLLSSLQAGMLTAIPLKGPS